MLPRHSVRTIVEHAFDSSRLEWPPPPVIPPPEEVIDDLIEDRPGAAQPVRWSEYLPGGMLADLLAQPAQTDPEHHEFEAVERVGGWERVIAWIRPASSPGCRVRKPRGPSLRVVMAAGLEVWAGSESAPGSEGVRRQRLASNCSTVPAQQAAPHAAKWNLLARIGQDTVVRRRSWQPHRVQANCGGVILLGRIVPR
ncbi:MAG: hypothetical protein ACRDSF_17205 [Pseudonocardiaceae bacterium]